MNGQYEQPPVINITDLMPASALSGSGFQVQPQVPTNGAMGQYTIVADPAVFKDDAGTYYVESLDMLKIRLSEIPAIEALDGMTNSSVFVQALASSAVRPVTAAANMVMHPMDTVTGLPSGVGDLFGRVSLGASQIASSARTLSAAEKLLPRPATPRSPHWVMTRCVESSRISCTSILTALIQSSPRS